MIHATATPFSFDVISTMSLGDHRIWGSQYGPWSIDYTDDVIALDGEPVALYSWEHAFQLAAGRPDALRWLAILQADAEARAEIRESWP